MYHFAHKEHMEISYKGNVCLAMVVVLLASVVLIMIAQVARQTHSKLLLLIIRINHNYRRYNQQPISHHNSPNLKNIQFLVGLNGFLITLQQLHGTFYSDYPIINPNLY